MLQVFSLDWDNILTLYKRIITGMKNSNGLNFYLNTSSLPEALLGLVMVLHLKNTFFPCSVYTAKYILIILRSLCKFILKQYKIKTYGRSVWALVFTLATDFYSFSTFCPTKLLFFKKLPWALLKLPDFVETWLICEKVVTLN